MSAELHSSTDDAEFESAAPDLSTILKDDLSTSELVTQFHQKKDTVFLEDGTAKVIPNKTRLISTLHLFVKMLFKDKELPYSLKINKHGVRSYEERRMASMIKMLPLFARLMDSDMASAPDISLMINEYRDHPIAHYRWLGGSDGSREFAEMANTFALHLQMRAKETKLTYRMNQWLRNADKNVKKLRTYVKWLVGKTARMVWIRLDLHLRKGEPLDLDSLIDFERKLLDRKEREYVDFMAGVDPDEIDFGVDRVSFFEIAKARREYLDFVRHHKELKKGYVGCVWSIEFASIEGYHVHMAFCYDGSVVNGFDHVGLAERLGVAWVKHTEGKGYFFNCNRKKYERPACGIVEYWDSAKLSNLWHALLYLAKKSQLAKVKASPHSKTFSTGQMSTRRSGRRRAKKDGLAEVDLDSS
ncbi:inovirus-type Gp2 protein [Herbaspirillum lusitanum]|uniref:inovirus-type Gp2 protein n=1 Tax=Herbaspirillum lusitanum TaxID=213312 RepID=UPI000308A608|nr:inovirus-type Gp2 protein [Herbaspirillum lusitanum]